MENHWAAEQLQIIRTLMERSAVYRRALAPIMTFAGTVGTLAGIVGWLIGAQSLRDFTAFWMSIGVFAASGAFLLVRRQALRASEPLWSLPTRRVVQALFPAYFAGLVLGMLAWATGDQIPLDADILVAAWMILYGCALHSAGFFMARGFKLFGWGYLLGGAGLMAARLAVNPSVPLANPHLLMGGAFGILHLAYGIYLYFTEKSGKSA